MRDFLGDALEVGDSVVFLKTPIVGEHAFCIGKVAKISKKKVFVEFPRNYGGKEVVWDCWRYPEQLIKTNVEFIEDEEH